MNREHKFDESITPFKNIVAILGEQFACRLTALYGGRRLYVPNQRLSSSKLAAHFDAADLQTLAALFGGMHIEVPQASYTHTRQVRARLEAYLRAYPRATGRTTAHQFSVHRRTVQRVRSEMRKREAALEAKRRGSPSLLTKEEQRGTPRKYFTP